MRARGVTNGVRQGGVLSPILFTLYMDDLLKELECLGVGCFWDSLYAGALCYADDLVLLAPSPSALRIMLCCCEKFAVSRGLRFNAAKTQLIANTLLILTIFKLSCPHHVLQPLSSLC